MKRGSTPLVIGNWKMNPLSSSLATKLVQDIKRKLSRVHTDVEVVIAPPIIYLSAVEAVLNGSKLCALGAQNVHHEKLGAHTGETSLPMLTHYGVTHCIIGHSERRADGESDTLIHEKVQAVLKAGLTAVLCVGERERDTAGQYLGYIEGQIRSALAKLSRAKLDRLVIAYEPVWAIGTGKNATPADAHEMKIFIEKILSDLYGRTIAHKIRILYGGSVNPKNAHELYTDGMIDGFLVGGASLHAEDFVDIVMQVTHEA